MSGKNIALIFIILINTVTTRETDERDLVFHPDGLEIPSEPRCFFKDGWVFIFQKIRRLTHDVLPDIVQTH